MPWIENLRPEGGMAGRAQPRNAAGGWYTIRNTADDEAEILLYDEVGGWLGATADQFVDELKAVTASRITLRINSPGGSVFDGIAIANALRAHPATVTTRVDGIAASIASVIAMAGDRLVMMPHSQLMIHDASGLCIGNAEDMRELAELLDRQSDNIADVYAAKAGGTREEWRERMRAETWYLAQEAVDAGLADEVADLPRKGREEEPEREREPAMAARWDLSVFRYAGREEAPAPAATLAPPEGLTEAIGAVLGEQIVAAVREAVRGEAPVEPALATGGIVSGDGLPLVGEGPVCDMVVPKAKSVEGAVIAVGEPFTGSLSAAMGVQPPDPPPPTGPALAATEEPDTPEVTGSTHDQPDPWAAMVAHLTTPADEWTSLVAHLTTPSSAATDA